MSECSRNWEGSPEGQRGVSEEQLARWEQELGVHLPRLLRDMLMVQDGGTIYSAQVYIAPLRQIEIMSEDWWDFLYWVDDEEDQPQRELFLQFAHDDFSGLYFLDYNECGPEGEPAVRVYYNGEGGDLEPAGDSFADFINRLTKVADMAQVNWQQSEAGTLLFDEKVDVSEFFGPGSYQHHRLLKRGSTLIHYVHSQRAAEEQLTETTLPMPLNTGHSQITSYGQSAGRTSGPFRLSIEPADKSGIVYRQSTRTSDGNWKNSVNHGAPIYVNVESAHKSRLETLQSMLLGTQATAIVREQQRTEQAWMQQMAELSPDQQKAALLQQMLMMRSTLPSLPHTDDPLINQLEGVMNEHWKRMQSEVEGVELPPGLSELARRMIDGALHPPQAEEE